MCSIGLQTANLLVLWRYSMSKKITNLMFRIFIFNDKNPLYLFKISTL